MSSEVELCMLIRNIHEVDALWIDTTRVSFLQTINV